jgi:hypothetical protein
LQEQVDTEQEAESEGQLEVRPAYSFDVEMKRPHLLEHSGFPGRGPGSQPAVEAACGEQERHDRLPGLAILMFLTELARIVSRD